MTFKELEKEEEILRNKVSSSNITNFYSNIQDKIKDPDTYAVLNWLFISGLHHFYLKKNIQGSINLILFIFSIITLSRISKKTPTS